LSENESAITSIILDRKRYFSAAIINGIFRFIFSSFRTHYLLSEASTFSRVAFSPAIRFAHKLTKKQSRLQALQF